MLRSPARAGQGGVGASGTNAATPGEKPLASKYESAGGSSLTLGMTLEVNGGRIAPRIKENGMSFYEIKADKHPIGAFMGEGLKYFTNHEIQLKKGDTVYIFTDGYQDQFGGPRGKKFMSKQFRQLFIDIQTMNMDEQKEHLDKTIEEWKGNGEQVDDILVIGVRV